MSVHVQDCKAGEKASNEASGAGKATECCIASCTPACPKAIPVSKMLTLPGRFLGRSYNSGGGWRGNKSQTTISHYLELSRGGIAFEWR
jgi:hypothetical protein